MGVVLERGGRWWATIFVVYALFVTGLSPVLAAVSPAPGEICIGASASAPGDPAAPSHHRLDCCILCQSAGLPAPAAAVVPAPILRISASSAPFPIHPDPPAARTPPCASPHAPRSPPIPS